jgi:ribosomal protein S6
LQFISNDRPVCQGHSSKKLAYPVKENSKAHCFVFAFQANQSTLAKK